MVEYCKYGVNSMPKKELVIYHSATGNTEKIAKEIASQIDCDLLKINKNDNPTQGRVSIVVKIVKQIIQRNQFKTDLNNIDLSSYNRIYIGSPCWFYTYTPPIEQFLKTTDYHNNEVVFFLTHGGGPRKTIEKFKASMIDGKYIGYMDFENVNKMREEDIKKEVNNQLIHFKQ